MQLADFSGVETDLFWRLMEFHHWAHPYDEKGQRHDFAAIPKRLTQLRDDPYRSLAGEVRKAGGYAGLRAVHRVPVGGFLSPVLRQKRAGPCRRPGLPQACVVSAVALARSAKARFLPGWSGVDAPAASRA